MSNDEKPTIGAEVIHLEPNPSHTCLTTIDSVSNSSLGPTLDQQSTSKEDYDPISSHPFSAFYSHPTTRTSFEQAKSQSKVHIQIYQHDLETGSHLVYPTESRDQTLKKKGCKNLCQMQKEQLGKERKRKMGCFGCSPFRKLSKKQRSSVQALIALILIGAIVGLSVGISKAVGGGINKTQGDQAPIGHGG
ncbi:hypothetical protein MMC28_005939 [Mycoblastus sanguinarius]|nr:hypothetical protein [Mycoblastus sanguinarius]